MLSATSTRLRLNNNHAPNNSGIFLIVEIITPILMLALTFYHRNATEP